MCCFGFTPRWFIEKQFVMLDWLHKNRSEGCTSAAMDGAAANGNLEMMKWLHENSTAGCTNKSTKAAARLGRLDILEWLHQHSLSHITVKTMNVAAANKQFKAGGHLRVVQWIFHIIWYSWPLCSVNETLVLAMREATVSEHFELMLFLEHHLNNYTCSTLRKMRFQWFRHDVIQDWFFEKYTPSRNETNE
ncbi:hypothetical protein PHMEG_00039089 [Phytophthora megakarya]|uniref:Uncharacterized protein n=1 Tax=Phytophthora megakarya TaxID=4795 RepID=A0A225UFR8_9STRA|nr:hypothetical protein PHMEG_00039089 [Phytophthora megakarya]